MISRSVGAFSQREIVGWRAKITAGVRQPSARQLEGRIPAQPVEVIAIGIAAADRQHAGAQYVRDRVSDAQQITPIGNVRGERVGNFAAALSQREQHHAGVEEDNRPPSNAAVTFLRETDGRLKLS